MFIKCAQVQNSGKEQMNNVKFAFVIVLFLSIFTGHSFQDRTLTLLTNDVPLTDITCRLTYILAHTHILGIAWDNIAIT